MLALPKLQGLNPTLDSTLLKMMEEIGELSEQLELLEEDEGSIINVAEELLDLAQTVVTLMFVFEEEGIIIREWLNEHVQKLVSKGYLVTDNNYGKILVKSDDKFQYLCLPKLKIKGVTLEKTLINISKAMGRIAQARGKFRGLNGEKLTADSNATDKIMGLSLLHVAQCCYTMMYVLKSQYNIDMDEIVQRHLEKLNKKGYMINE